MKSINPTETELLPLVRTDDTEAYSIKFTTHDSTKFRIIQFEGKFLLIEPVATILGERSISLALGQILALESGLKSFSKLNWDG